jgi:transcriptional regulator GlxA family with amidase domain
MRSIVVDIIVFDDVEVLDCCGPFEVFSVANRVAEATNRQIRFAPAFVATTPRVSARGGLALEAQPVAGRAAPDVLLVAGGVTTRAEHDAALIEWISTTAVTAEVTGSICTGAFLLATAEVLTHHRVTTHWEDQTELARRWPTLRVESGPRWIHDDIYTSAGISACLDLSLRLVTVLAEVELATATARQMDYTWRQ